VFHDHAVATTPEFTESAPGSAAEQPSATSPSAGSPPSESAAAANGAVSDPKGSFKGIVWPKGIQARGELRHQYHHSTDIVPTILDIAGLEMPAVYKGVPQYPLNGISMRYTFDAKPDAPTQKKRQYYAMLGTRGI